MRADHFQSWRREREAIEQKMDCLIAEGLPTSIEERRIRRMQFAALIEQREAAARKLLELAKTSRHDKSSKEEGVAGNRAADAHPPDLIRPSIDAVVSAADRTNVNPHDAATPNSLPEYAVQPATGVAPHGSDAAALPIGSAVAPVATLTADTAAALKEEVVHDPDAATLPTGSATAPVAAPTADASAASKAEVAHHPNAAALLTGSAATGHLADAVGMDVVAQAPDAATLPPVIPHLTISGLSTEEMKPTPVVRYCLNAAALTECAPAPAARADTGGRAVVSDDPHTATLPHDAAVVTSPRLSKEDAKPTNGVARAAAALPPHSAAIPADAAATSKAGVGHNPDASAIDSAVMPDASPSAKIAQHSSDVSALNPAASPVGLPAENAKFPDDIALLAHSVSIPAATVPDPLLRTVPDPLLRTVPDPLLPMDRTKTDDVHSDRSLLKLLQRLQSKLSRGGKETRDD